MDTEFDICGTHISYDKITDYSLVHREYIYRPSFIEISNTQKKLFQTYTTTQYKFERMLPYAMILSREDMDFKKATKSASVNGLGGAIVKEAAVGALSIISHKITRKRFRCKNIAGRCFTVFLNDIPSVIEMSDGRIIDVYKNDELHKQINQSLEPTIQMVSALRILTKEKEYFFFGDGIQLDNVEMEYQRLKYELSSYKDSVKKLKSSEKPAFELKNPFVKLFGKNKTTPALEESTDANEQSATDKEE